MSYTRCEICNKVKPSDEIGGFSNLAQVCWICQSNPLAMAVRRAQDLKTELTEMWIVAERREAREKRS